MLQRFFFFFFVLSFLWPVTQSAASSSGMARVNESQTLRCGYVEYFPALTKDMKTGKWSGFNYDILKAIGQRLELDVKYAASTGWATVVADLNAKKFDMLCSGFWVHPNVGKFALFTRPVFFQPVFVVARVGDKRFSKTNDLNDEKLTMVALDGDNPVNIAHADFPKAKVLTLPNMTDFSQVLAHVATKKADFTIVDAVTFGEYNKNNSGKLHIVDSRKPIRIYPVSYVFHAEDYLLRDAVNAALDELILDGSIDHIFNKYDVYPHSYYRPVVPFANPYRD